MRPIRAHKHKHPTFCYNILTNVIRIFITDTIFFNVVQFIFKFYGNCKKKKEEYYFAYCTISLKFILKNFKLKHSNVLQFYSNRISNIF